MKVKYWIADCLYDASAADGSGYTYQSVRAQTKKECLALRDRRLKGISQAVYRFSEPHRVTIYYDSVFDLLRQATSEAGLDEHTVSSIRQPNWPMMEGTSAY